MSLLSSAVIMSAQSSGAMVYASGDVKLNGNAVGGSSSVFDGDRLVTANSSTVSLNRNGSTVVVSPNSAVQYRGSVVDISSGSARVTTVNGMSAQVGGVTVTPKSQNASFEVARVNNEVVVTSREGEVTVNNGGRSIMVQPGSNAKLDLSAGLNNGENVVPISQMEKKSALVASGPFYSIQSASDLPICPTANFCDRTHVSQIKPCKCLP